MAWHEMRHRARLVKNLAEVPPVDANAARLGQVFLSLLINEAIPESHADVHEIRVLTHVDERGYAVIEVSDTGSGISPEDMPCTRDGPGESCASSPRTPRDTGALASAAHRRSACPHR